MSKILGYVIALIGLVIMLLSFKLSLVPFLASVKPLYVTFAGIAVIIIGIAISVWNTSSSARVKQAAEEVPIYEGDGKNKKIVGYKRAR
jgi:hypothetical protein